MKFASPLTEATLLKRYKRFLADITLQDGKTITIYCPNTGAMTNCDVLGSRVWFSTSQNKQRKYPYTWELVEVDDGDLVGINTALPNKLVVEAINNGKIAELAGYDTLETEVNYGKEKSRVDIRLSNGSQQCYVEVKNVTLCDEQGKGYFPDAVTKRGAKHLRELIDIRRQGHRAVVFYCVQHTGIMEVYPAQKIDPLYAQTLHQAVASGVEVIAYQAEITTEEVWLQSRLPAFIAPSMAKNI